MTEQMTEQTSACQCENAKATFHIPLKTCLHIEDDGSGEEQGGPRAWESDWFTAYAGTAYDFTHNLNLEAPWLCKPSLVCFIGECYFSTGYESGTVRFTEGLNTVGNSAKTEEGWTISLARNTCRVSIGNSRWMSSGKRKLVIRY